MILRPRCGPHTVQPGRVVANCEGLAAHLERPWLREVSFPLQVCAQLCPTPCVCPWPPPQCPLGVPLVLDGCNCCRVCARRLGESCNHLYVCDPSQGLVCQLRAGPGSQGAVCLCKQVCGTDGGCGWRQGVVKAMVSSVKGKPSSLYL